MASLQGSDCGVIATSEVHELLMKFMTFWIVPCTDRLVAWIEL